MILPCTSHAPRTGGGGAADKTWCHRRVVVTSTFRPSHGKTARLQERAQRLEGWIVELAAGKPIRPSDPRLLCAGLRPSLPCRSRQVSALATHPKARNEANGTEQHLPKGDRPSRRGEGALASGKGKDSIAVPERKGPAKTQCAKGGQECAHKPHEAPQCSEGDAMRGAVGSGA